MKNKEHKDNHEHKQHKKHKLETHSWHRARLVKKELWFDSLEEALEQAAREFCEIWKIFDSDDCMVCSSSDKCIDSPYT